MKLDSRITVSHKDILNCYDVNDDDYFKNNIPLKGYFSFRLGYFFDLSECDYGTLDKIDKTDNDKGSDDVFHRSENDCYYSYFLPECYVKKEKKYRPFTLKEFTDKFQIGRPIKFREKDKEDNERYLILNGYHKGKTATFVHFGAYPFTLEELFNNYEWQDADENWVIFGVEE